jgi:CheY-like chemotaxis protein
MLAVSDTGIGMNSETQARMFEPFFSTKEADKGTGLGLATVYGIVKQSGGSIWVYSELGHGTTFKIYLPRTQQEAGAVAIEKRAVPLRGTETVLLVEDEPGVRRLAERLLRRAGYDVLVAQNPGEALVLSERPAGAVHLLVTDVIMPHMSGFDLAARLKAVWPDLRVLFVSGYTDLAVSKHNLAGLDAPLLQKPFTAEALMTRVRETLDRPSRTPDGL